MQIIFMTPGSGDNFYCENCLRDKAVITALRAAGHDAMSVPLYLPPLMTDTRAGSDVPIFFGGINVFLQQHLGLFRRTPRWLDRLLDSRWLLKLAARRAGTTAPAELGQITLSMLQGEDGRQAKELDRLVDYLRTDTMPDVVVLSNALLLGIARRIKNTLGCALVCMLQDEHDFVDSLPDDFSDQAWQLMRDRARHVDMFVAPGRYYADLMAGRLGLAPGRVRVVYNGIDPEGYIPADRPPAPPVIGYLSRQVADHGRGRRPVGGDVPLGVYAVVHDAHPPGGQAETTGHQVRVVPAGCDEHVDVPGAVPHELPRLVREVIRQGVDEVVLVLEHADQRAAERILDAPGDTQKQCV